MLEDKNLQETSTTEEVKSEEVNNKEVETETNEVVNETKPEETKSEEITPVDMESVNIHEMNLNINTDNLEETVETKRSSVHGQYAKARKISNIATLIMVVFVIASFILIVQEMSALKITGYVIGGVALVGMLIYYICNRNRLPGLIKEYMSDVNATFNAYLYKDEKFENLSMNPDEKADMGEVSADKVYLNVGGCGSRNVIHGTYKDHKFMIADLALSGVGAKSKQVDYFVGKYLNCSNEFKFDGRVIINMCLKGEKQYDLPTDINDLNKVESNEDYTVYATPGLDYAKIVNQDLINKLHKLEVKEEKHLLNVNIVIWGGNTAVYLSYDNTLMSFPFDQPFKKESLSQFKKDQNVVFDIFDLFFKEKTVKTDSSVKLVEHNKPEEEVKTEEKPKEETKKDEETKK